MAEFCRKRENRAQCTMSPGRMKGDLYEDPQMEAITNHISLPRTMSYKLWMAYAIRTFYSRLKLKQLVDDHGVQQVVNLGCRMSTNEFMFHNQKCERPLRFFNIDQEEMLRIRQE